MAKKKTGIRTRSRKPTAKVSPRRSASRPRSTGPRSQTLPGLSQVRDQKLDNITEGIAEERERKNAADTEEKSLITSPHAVPPIPAPRVS